MEKIRSVALVLIGVSLVMIFSGCVSSFVIGLRNDQENVRARMEDVSAVFEDFSAEVSIFEEQRDLLYGEVLSTFFYETVYSEDKLVKTRLSNYEALVDLINKKRISLDKLCDDAYYPDSSINSKCSNYKTIYEQVVNCFVTDINFYNKSMTDYNKYATSLGNSNLVSSYKTSKKFIDFNGDKVFDGREEATEK